MIHAQTTNPIVSSSGGAAAATVISPIVPTTSNVDSVRRKISLHDCFTPSGPNSAHVTIYSAKQTLFDPLSTHLTVGDIVSIHSPTSTSHATPLLEGIIVECLDHDYVKVDLGDDVRQFPLSLCSILLRNDEYELGDSVEVQPIGSSLFFVGKVIKMDNIAKTLDVLMDGDDPDDIEYAIPIENARKLMSRRAEVVNRWKKAFVKVVAANFFRRIQFDDTIPHNELSMKRSPSQPLPLPLTTTTTSSS